MIAAIVFIGAFFIRVYNVGLLPINHDEAYWVRSFFQAPQLIKQYFWILGNPLLFNTQHLIIFCVLKYNPTGLNEVMRVQPAVIGALTVLFVYYMARQMYGHKTALIAALILCFLPWHIIQSRITGRVILLPLFGVLVFLCLFKALEAKKRIFSRRWFIASCLFLSESIRTYETAMLFIPIILILLLIFYRRLKERLGFKWLLFGIAVLILFISPLILKIASGTDKFMEEIFWRHYQKNVFEGNIIFNLLTNFRSNFNFAVHQLFFSSQAQSFLYGQALKGPLLIHPLMFALCLLSLVLALWRRTIADTILTCWLIICFFCVIGGINIFQARYIFIIIPPVIILISRFLTEIFESLKLARNRSLKLSWLSIFILIVGFLLITEIRQWLNYEHNSSIDLTECRHNSYGCKQVAHYLNKIPNLKDYALIYDTRMTVDIYLGSLFLKEGKIGELPDILYSRPVVEKERSLYMIWAPESHPEDFWAGMFEHLYKCFKQKYPDKKPLKTIYYPTGLAAIHIFEGRDMH